ncbi:aminodeoxychorismate synthase component I [Sphingomonas oligoaromativorans]|uniref:aminodeoxychorismate synthase component I n=1 Tax=Sphingomonas oligoaromativorans TaxID=575322 RepID=UPI001ABBDEEC|nr:aminodeoxychorismate synthase component I [Sphingomonas oligoaromativorans]NIJ33036.1 para-aminobenzoate synthetase/4-amino-4-deoxychorismate lyase [Sphingomonas oligoaromativorans]
MTVAPSLPRLDRSRPFVLLDDATGAGTGPARLYRDPAEVVTASTREGLAEAFAALRAAQARGLHAAGWIAYDAGAPGEASTGAVGEGPLLWFGLFERYETIPAADVPSLFPDPAGAWAGAPAPRIAFAAYAEAFARVEAYIAAGDIYQANLTFQADVATAGDPLALYARIRGRAAAGWGGIVHDGRRTLLSFSPEMFFRLDGRRIEARPMKGTATRGADPLADAEAIRTLASDAKQRAENLMIVDLIRNDLSRIAVPGSVAVPALFTVETYPTIHQMTSTVTAELAEGGDAVGVLEAAFPCGSITGAPKLRAMEIAAEVEQGPRGAYTGAIGRIDAGGDAAFNVAIRTLTIGEAGRAAIGLGSGIVADSDVGAEWRECLAKGGFIGAACPPFDLLETMLFDPLEGVMELERHLLRLKRSTQALGFVFNRHDVRNELQAATFRLRDPARVRLRVSRTGRAAVEVRPLPAPPIEPVVAPVVPLSVDPSDFRLAHKTSDRAFHDAARAGHFEVLFVRPDGLLTEGSFTNLFVRGEDGRLRTPPLARGLLPGILRERLLAEGQAVESDIVEADLRDGFLLGNALRGLIRARLP